MKYLLARFYMAVLVVALIAVPCLPLISSVQAGAALAHSAPHTQNAMHKSDTGNVQSAHHAGHQMHCSQQDMSSCGDDCVTWQVSRRFDDNQAADLFVSAAYPDAANSIMAAHGLAQEFHPPNMRRKSRQSGRLAVNHKTPVYALSQRFRL